MKFPQNLKLVSQKCPWCATNLKFMSKMSNVLNFGGLMNFYCFASDITRLFLSLLLSLSVLSFAFWQIFLIIFLLSSNFSGFALYLYGSLYIVSITSLLDISIEWIVRRYWMLFSDLRTKHLEFYLPTPLIFHGHISIHLSLSWKFPSQI